MAYLVNLTSRAERDLARLYDEMNAEHAEAALKWCRGLKDAILNLEKRPTRCAATPEKAQFKHLLYGHKPHVYRVIFQVLERERHVVVLHLRHGARRGLGSAARRRR